MAILDTGIDYDAPDLNGLVDLSRSTSFVPSDDAIATAFFPTRNKISDFNGHGTNVATQVSSKAFVFAGVTSKTTLIGVKVLGASRQRIVERRAERRAVGRRSRRRRGEHEPRRQLRQGGERTASCRSSTACSTTRRRRECSSSSRPATPRPTSITTATASSTYCDVPHVVCVSAVGPALATDDPDTPAFYTNFGRSAISVAAPGGNADVANA